MQIADLDCVTRPKASYILFVVQMSAEKMYIPGQAHYSHAGHFLHKGLSDFPELHPVNYDDAAEQMRERIKRQLFGLTKEKASRCTRSVT